MLFLTPSEAAEKGEKNKIEHPKEAIVQSILDHAKLQSFLHPENPGRVPLVLSDRLIGRDLNLIKFGKPVSIVSDKTIEGAYLRFTAFDCKNGNYCNIAFEYPVEGVIGVSGVLIRANGSHKLEKTEIMEQ